MHERVSHRSEAAAQITRKLLRAESGDRLQDTVVRPAVVFVEQLNIIFSHRGGRPTPLGDLTLPREFGKTLHAALLRPWQLFPSDGRLGSNFFKINSTCLVSSIKGVKEKTLHLWPEFSLPSSRPR
jgi:hypothetical protein